MHASAGGDRRYVLERRQKTTASNTSINIIIIMPRHFWATQHRIKAVTHGLAAEERLRGEVGGLCWTGPYDGGEGHSIHHMCTTKTTHLSSRGGSPFCQRGVFFISQQTAAFSEERGLSYCNPTEREIIVTTFSIYYSLSFSTSCRFFITILLLAFFSHDIPLSLFSFLFTFSFSYQTYHHDHHQNKQNTAALPHPSTPLSKSPSNLPDLTVSRPSIRDLKLTSHLMLKPK